MIYRKTQTRPVARIDDDDDEDYMLLYACTYII